MAGESNADAVSLQDISIDEIPPGNILLQRGFWGHFKAQAGWTPRAFAWKTGTILVLERSLPGGMRMAYVPFGPSLPDGADSKVVSDLVADLARALKARLSPGCFMIRFDLMGGNSSELHSDPGRPEPLMRPLRPAPYRVQPPDTVLLSLTGEEGDLMAGMHKKTRYNIRLSARKGVEIRRFAGEAALEPLSVWYELYRETGKRDGIALHPESYYRRLFSQAADSQDLSFSLYMAESQGEVLAGIIVARSGERSTYMYGASSSEKRELMPNHLLQWTAIQDARNEGSLEYDFFGIPPADDPGHPLHGLWRFKTGFGGRIHHFYGAWDYPYKVLVYRLYASAERIRGRLAARRKKR